MRPDPRYLPLVLTLLVACSCAPLPRTQVHTAIAPAPSAAGTLPRCVGYLPLLPLPPNYPPGYTLHERAFTGEVFAKDASGALVSAALVFFPKDYLVILESSFVHTLRAAGVAVTSYRSVSQARAGGCPLLVWAIPLAFHVEGETNTVVRVLYQVIGVSRGEPASEWTIETLYAEPRTPRSITSDTLVFMIGSHQFNFQPQRALLAIATARNVTLLLRRLAGVDAAPQP